MARVIEPSDVMTESPSRDKRPWNDWLNGEYWTFDEGIDYAGPPRLFIKQIRYQAQRRDLKIRVIENTGDSITIRAYKP